MENALLELDREARSDGERSADEGVRQDVGTPHVSSVLDKVPLHDSLDDLCEGLLLGLFILPNDVNLLVLPTHPLLRVWLGRFARAYYGDVGDPVELKWRCWSHLLV